MAKIYQGATFRGSPSGKIVRSHFLRTEEDLEADEVVVKVTHSGLCGTDLHYRNRDMVLGHEGVGTVIALSSKPIHNFRARDRVGFGFYHSTCGSCEPCLTGHDCYCDNRQMYGTHNLDQGSFAEFCVWKAQWLIKIPDGIPSAEAATLMCAGVSVFSPLLKHVKPTDRVGVVGVGGLGHLAIQFARKMGCEVVVFSRSPDKREECLAWGARDFYCTTNLDDFDSLGISKSKKIHKLLVCTADDIDWQNYVKILGTLPTVIPLTVSHGALEAPYDALILKGLRVVGSVPTSKLLFIQTLEFAERNDIHPKIEAFSMRDGEQKIMDVMERLKNGDIRYRVVFAWD
ncbi:alcohol dehydrogenase [Moniliophthora roreri MCA 2997]|uniref:Alcohol dehydrogenase n=1 Tax=Moniliophthora roreri (strain MCA 2997) TaxID=1381753 RepID=V2YI45_MONRO|nr:alcohol dehydrogenase [Moniliophthora roreri MCA 2997]